ncbi:Holliday junction branch migration protein RuvA [Jeotgalibaca caeni]|uniref:Holliday junction branch migration protein RuvA n=1 Tax=Jeotgalibaca caeni TaxID=3028623 RepID=UPI00237D4215|nr:Holliday junction branch migration protein RuvA [Jeotgalibaca caeni]MDE1548968.1 Holliday junction branch migration protein RuvA [Jeotgalibaca caeni]
MYEYMRGELVAIHPLYIVVDVQGIGYQIYVANPYRFSTSLNEEVKVYIYQAIREDAMTLYGFLDEYEKQLYLKLISVSGIGPKSGLTILANGDFHGLIQAIEAEDVRYLTKFPGVGKKTASQIILDLKGKLTDLIDGVEVPVIPTQTSFDSKSPFFAEAEEALKGLGYTVKDIARIMPQLEQDDSFQSTEEVLRQAFKLLLKN